MDFCTSNTKDTRGVAHIDWRSVVQWRSQHVMVSFVVNIVDRSSLSLPYHLHDRISGFLGRHACLSVEFQGRFLPVRLERNRR